jgi:hypothetical protein
MFSVTRRTNPESEQPKAARYSCVRAESRVGNWLPGQATYPAGASLCFGAKFIGSNLIGSDLLGSDPGGSKRVGNGFFDTKLGNDQDHGHANFHARRQGPLTEANH